jgi:dipeptidyl aminopeptidase/acylaminoacyl peptidase
MGARFAYGLVLAVCYAGLAGAAYAGPPAGEAARSRPVSVADMITFRRVLTPSGASSQPMLSPDGQRYLLIIAAGDLARDGYWAEFWTGDLRSARGAEPHLAGRLFTTALAGADGVYPPIHPVFLHVVWLPDSRSVVFPWSDGTKPTELNRLDLDTGTITALSSSKASIEYFDISPDGRELLYSAFPSDVKCPKSGAVSALSLPLFLKEGCVDAQDQWRRLTEYVEPIGRDPIVVATDPSLASYPVTPVVFSPTNLFAVVPQQAIVASDPAWSSYPDKKFQEARRSYLADPGGGWLLGAAVLDLRKATKHSLGWMVNPLEQNVRALWSPDGNSVVFGPTYLPPVFGSQGNRGVALVRYDPVTGQTEVLPKPSDGIPELVEWNDRSGLAVRYGATVYRFDADQSGIWNVIATTLTNTTVAQSSFHANIREDLGHPPMLVISDAKGKNILSWPIEPKLSQAQLGKVAITSWQDARGQRWSGRLYYPLNYKDGTRYPLVVQTHGFAPAAKFSLTGISEAYGTTFAAIPLSQVGMFVVQVEDHHDTDEQSESRNQAGAYEAAVRSLEKQNLIDPARVGIAGFSRSGWYVETALAFGNFRYAAAIVSANINYSYEEAAANIYDPKSMAPYIGANVTGSGMAKWLENSPTFSADRIRTPLRIELPQAGPVAAIGPWDLFMRLRREQLPVEMVLLANAERGSHPLQNPAMRYESEQGAVDWFRFWLQDYEDPSPDKAAQYFRWRRLREERDAASKVLRPSLLQWSATPVKETQTAPE